LSYYQLGYGFGYLSLPVLITAWRWCANSRCAWTGAVDNIPESIAAGVW